MVARKAPACSSRISQLRSARALVYGELSTFGMPDFISPLTFRLTVT